LKNNKHEIIEKMWATFCSGLIGQQEVKENFKPYFESIFYQASLGKIENSTYGGFLLCGPTGVGKGEFARALAKTFHGSTRNILTINCAEFHSQHEVARLLGAPPGYLGHRETQAMLSQGRLNAVSSDKSSISIILWDEVEKGHRDIFNSVLSILDRAELRLGDNNLVNFSRTLHIFTSNLGNSYDEDAKAFLVKEERDSSHKKNLQRAAINKFFRKEFLGRMTSTFYFKAFDNEALSTIFDNELDKFFAVPCASLSSTGSEIIEFVYTDEVKTKILELSNTAEFGARELIHQIRKTVGILGLREIYNLACDYDKSGQFRLKFALKNGEFICKLQEVKQANANCQD